ncbi:MAG: sigma-70 family RNA polymerase sigma factor [Deltaproteobacteria bacterium]|nr:sigma-70 family RNA polymerase sigma factor [Deltaproteobacteria bacterium]
MRRCQEGDERAWAELYRTCAPLVARFVGRLVGPSGPVDDLVQAVFVEVLRSIRRFRGEARLTTWLYGVAHRVTARHIRGETRRRDERWGEARATVAASPELTASARESLAVVERAVLELPEAQRSVWVMRELEGLSTAEVAEALGVPLGTVRSRLFAGRQHVLAALEASPVPVQLDPPLDREVRPARAGGTCEEVE